MLTVLLYGHLAEKYGRKHRLEISTPAEAIRAFCANHKDFRNQIIQDGQALYRVLAGKEDRADENGLHTGTSKTIKIVPVIAGSGGLGKILLGAVLIGLSIWLPMVSPLGTTLLFGTTTVGSFLGGIGVSLVLSGVSSLLFAPPKPSSSTGSSPAAVRPSFGFNGAVNTIGQGNPVPVLYGGPLRAGSQVISAGLSTSDL